MERAEHWDGRFRATSEADRSWSQDVPSDSLHFIDLTGTGPDDAVVDVGGGASRLVDELLRRGHTDLTVGGLKFSGNAQRRQRHCLIFHGSFLLNLDLSLVEQALPLPSRQPGYRASRAHADFLINLRLPASAIKSALGSVWHAAVPLSAIPSAHIQMLARQKYGSEEWNLKF